MRKQTARTMLTAVGIAFALSTAQADSATTVRTPRNTAVAATLMTFQLSAAEITAINNQIAQQYPQASRIASASRKYNCHSYAWHSQSTANDKWINTPNEDLYWTDGSYRRVATVNGQLVPPSTGVAPLLSKVSWGNNDHSAIRQTSTHLRSKWGQGPLMQHRPGYSPYSCADQQCSFTLNYYVRN